MRQKMSPGIFLVVSGILIFWPVFGVSVNENFNFSRNYFGVSFIPPVFLKNEQHVEATYSKTDILQLLDTVSTRFSKLVGPTLGIGVSLNQSEVAHIPILAAVHNVPKNQSVVRRDNVLQLFLSYKIQPAGNSRNTTEPVLVTSFEATKAVADAANRIYKNTVNHLLTFVSQRLLNKNMTGILTKHFTTVKRDIAHGVFKYKIGVKADIYYCGEASTRVEYFFNKILPVVDVILFEPFDEMGVASCGVAFAVQCMEKKFKKCKRKLERLHPHLEVVFSTEWRRAKDPSDIDISNMVQFWKKMNVWAVESNTTVIMYDALDDPAGGEREGWWTVEKDNLGKAYSVKERHSFVSSISPSQKYDASAASTNKCLGPLTFNESTPNDGSTTGKHWRFSNTHFGVQFWPYVKITDDRSMYDEVDTIPFIEKISTRFTNIITLPVTEEDVEESRSMSHVPNAAAKMNRKMTMEHQPNGGTSIVQVLMQFELETLEQIHAKRLSEKAVVPFDIAKQLADKANLIYPGTVKYLLLEVGLLTSVSKVHSVMRQLEYARLQKGNFTYELGLTLSYENCDVEGILTRNRRGISPLIQQISMILFISNLGDREREAGAEKSFEKLTTLFSICGRLIKRMNPQIKVGFIEVWFDTNTSGPRNVSALSWFWNKMNNWAMETDNMVFMENVFDILRIKNTGGWWRFVEDKPYCYENTGEYTFIEKVMEKDDPPPNVTTGVNNISFQSGNSLLEGNRTNFLLAGKYNVSFRHPHDKMYFSRPKFVVLFNPYVEKKIQVVGYSEEDIESFLNIVETRFSKLFLPPVNENSRSLRRILDRTPKIAAKINNLKKRNLEEVNVVENLQVFVSLNFEPRRSTETAFYASVNFALDLAEEANAISENTVPYILLMHNKPFIDPIRCESADVQMKYFKNKAQQKTNKASSTLPIQIGGMIPSEYCRVEEYFAVATQHLLPNLQLIVIAFTPTMQEMTTGVDTAFTKVIQTFEGCKSKIGAIFPNLKVGLFSGWYDTEDSRKSNPLNLAFETPSADFDTGWWSLAPVEKNSNGSEVHYMIQERYDVVSQNDFFHEHEDKESTVFENDGKSGTLSTVLVPAATIVGVLIFITCGVAFMVIQKIRRDAVAALQRLSNDELQEFFEGVRDISLKGDEEEGGQNNYLEKSTSLVKRFAYDTSLEVSKETFLIDEGSKLGSGAFGTVCLARICKDGNEIPVAVKRVNSCASPEMSMCSLRSLLSEVKVLSFLGEHENVVKLLAVHTGSIRKGEIYVFLEPCALGSLKKYLGTLLTGTDGNVNEDYYLDLLNEEPKKSKSDQDAEDCQLLAQWSLQIAQGMEFLASKHIVHADLATRNVLLDRKKMAKICDFGLSRRMYCYESYVKAKQEPLPWRWMSPESLRRWEFNEKTDVWAYGVTLWEVYTLGEVPYPGLAWDQHFSCHLEEGLRPREPVHNPPGKYKENDMYQIMMKCWDNEPKRRPSFADIISILVDRN